MEEECNQMEISFKGFTKEEKEMANKLIERMSKNIEEYWLDTGK